MAGALEGIRVLEWTAAHAGPHAGALLGDLGASCYQDRTKGG